MLDLKVREQAGAAVEPGPLNFWRGKLLLHTPARHPLPESPIASFDRLGDLLRERDFHTKGLVRPEDFKRMRHQRREVYSELVLLYMAAVFELHAEIGKRGILSPAAIFGDKVQLYSHFAKMRLAGVAFTFGISLASGLACTSISSVLRKLEHRGVYATPILT